MQQESKTAGSSDQRENSMKKGSREKRKPHSNLTEDQSLPKRQKSMSQNLKMINEKEKIEATDSVEKSKVEEAEHISNKPEGASKRETNNESPRKSKRYNDQCTAFVSNLSIHASCILPYHYLFSLQFFLFF